MTATVRVNGRYFFFSLLRWVCEFDGREGQSRGKSKSRGALNEVIYREVPPQGPISSLILYAILNADRNKDPFLYQARTLHPLNYCKCKLSFSQPKMRPLARTFMSFYRPKWRFSLFFRKLQHP